MFGYSEEYDKQNSVKYYVFFPVFTDFFWLS